MADLVTVTITASGTWKVPSHVPGTLKMAAVAGGGGDYNPTGGNLSNRGGIGGHVRGTLDIARGTLLTLGIGGRGEDGEVIGVTVQPAGGGGPRPGGAGGWYGSNTVPPSSWTRAGAGGGGGTEVLIGSTVVAVAGGGGGGATKSGIAAGSRAGNGAEQTGDGDDGTPVSATVTQGQGGFGGTTSGVGAGGASASFAYPTYVEAGFDGSAGSGGDGASVIYVEGSPSAGNGGGGGGGGGGYFGAGGGGGSNGAVQAGRGGGGSSWSNSSYVTEGDVLPFEVPASSVAGYIVFEWEPDPSGWFRGHPWG